MKNKKTILLIGLGVAAIALAYFLFFRKKAIASDAEGAANSMPAYNSQDDATFQKLTQLFQQHIGKPVPGWLMNSAKEYFDGVHGNGQMDAAYRPGGKVTKSGAFMAAFASDWFKKGNAEAESANTAMWAVFDPFRSRNTF